MGRYKGSSLLVFVFFLSGISGLMYEIVWLRMLSRIMGVTSHAAAITLGSYMLGLGAGAFIFGKLADRVRSPLKMFMLLQFLIAATALLSPLAFGAGQNVMKLMFHAGGDSKLLLMLFRIIISFLCMLGPTLLMGGTLPAITAHLTRQNGKFEENISVFYAVNTIGAVLGVILSGFFTIGILGEWQTIFIAAALNLIAAQCALYVLKKEPDPGNATASEAAAVREPLRYPGKEGVIALAAVAVSGFAAMAFEIIWTRHFVIYLGPAIYTFSFMLATVLSGIGIGSMLLNVFSAKIRNKMLFLGSLFGIEALLFVVNLYLFPLFDGPPVLKFLSALIMILPVSVVFGMIFPAANMIMVDTDKKVGTGVGKIFIFNTIGSLLGAFLTGFFLINTIGSTKTILIISGFSVAMAVLLVMSGQGADLKSRLIPVLPALIAVFAALPLFGTDSFLSVLEKRIRVMSKSYNIYLNKECIEGTITAFESNGNKGLLINGTGQTLLATDTKLMAHLPLLLADKPSEMLIVCFGMGTVVKSASLYKDLSIDVVELVPEIMGLFGFYHKEAARVLSNKNIKLHADDGRNYLLLTDKRYDVIVADPSPPIYSAGTVNLYTKEFFGICRRHLTDGGVMCMWVPGGETNNEADEKMIIRTFAEVFPDMLVFRGPRNWGYYLMGKTKKIIIDTGKVTRIFSDKEIVSDMREYNDIFYKQEHFYGSLLYDHEMAMRFCNDYPVITDNNPYTEFPLFRLYK